MTRAFGQRAAAALDYLAIDPAMVQVKIDEAAELIAGQTFGKG